MLWQKNALTGLLLVGMCTTAAATDHIDGSRTVNAPTIDLTDLYAFTSGARQERLVVVLDIITAAQAWERPDPAASFEIVFGAVARDRREPALRILPQPHYRLRCSWQAQAAVCIGPEGTRVEAPLGKVLDPAAFRLFAGPRSDPFVLNGLWAGALAMDNKVPDPFDANIIHGFNVYSLVAEIDIATLLPSLEGHVIALGAEVRNATGEQILDRIGRPEIANIALQSNTGPDLRDDLNSYPALTLPNSFRSIVQARLRENLDRYDAMDPTPYRSDKDMLADILADDFLTIDPTLSCEGAKYFDLETAILEGRKATRCGGRPLEQDIIDSVYGLLIHGSARERIADGAATPTRAPSADFPYLAAPNIGVQAAVKALTGRGLSLVSAPGPGRNAALIGFAASMLALLVLLGVFARWIWRQLD